MASIAIMNAKGGVGKSTLTMAIAETLSVYHGKSVLVVDADGQMSLSLMMMRIEKLNAARQAGRSISAWLRNAVLTKFGANWNDFIVDGVSDVDDAKTIFCLPGDMDLPLVEREIAAQHLTQDMRTAARAMLDAASKHFDMVLVDCAPGISVMTECWLRECDYHLVPLKPDVLAIGGMEYLRSFKQRDPELGFAHPIGVVVNMFNPLSEIDRVIVELLAAKKDLGCFQRPIPAVPHIQKAAMFTKEGRSYLNKYPAEAGQAIRLGTAELMERVATLDQMAAGVMRRVA